MFRFKEISQKFFSIGLSLLIAISCWFSFQQPAQADNIFNEIYRRVIETINPPPKRDVAGRNGGTAGRGPNCPILSEEPSLVALVPSQDFQISDINPSIAQAVWGVTVETYPTFWFYIPYKEEDVSQAEFMLLDITKYPVLQQPVPVKLTKTPGIISFQSPYPLRTNQLYNWYFSILCDADRPSKNPGVKGWIKRVEPDENLLSHLQTSEAKYMTYAENGIWFEAMTDLAEKFKLTPTDPRLQASWNETLNALGIGELAQSPILDCCSFKR